MKKTVLLMALCMFVAAVSISEAGVVRNNAGCGLGSMAFGDKDGLLFQLLASSTNGICGNQTFGMTSGTLGCAPMKGIVSNEKINNYVADNMDNLATDIAKGQGEYLNTLAVLMDVPENDRTQLYTKLQSNFSKIYTSENVTSEEIVQNISKVTDKG
ncbi:MAG: DUF3015 family protein [Spirochaetota bacterium]